MGLDGLVYRQTLTGGQYYFQLILFLLCIVLLSYSGVLGLQLLAGLLFLIGLTIFGYYTVWGKNGEVLWFKNGVQFTTKNKFLSKGELKTVSSDSIQSISFSEIIINRSSKLPFQVSITCKDSSYSLESAAVDFFNVETNHPEQLYTSEQMTNARFGKLLTEWGLKNIEGKVSLDVTFKR